MNGLIIIFILRPLPSLALALHSRSISHDHPSHVSDVSSSDNHKQLCFFLRGQQNATFSLSPVLPPAFVSRGLVSPDAEGFSSRTNKYIHLGKSLSCSLSFASRRTGLFGEDAITFLLQPPPPPSLPLPSHSSKPRFASTHSPLEIQTMSQQRSFPLQRPPFPAHLSSRSFPPSPYQPTTSPSQEYSPYSELDSTPNSHPFGSPWSSAHGQYGIRIASLPEDDEEVLDEVDRARNSCSSGNSGTQLGEEEMFFSEIKLDGLASPSLPLPTPQSTLPLPSPLLRQSDDTSFTSGSREGWESWDSVNLLSPTREGRENQSWVWCW